MVSYFTELRLDFDGKDGEGLGSASIYFLGNVPVRFDMYCWTLEWYYAKTTMEKLTPGYKAKLTYENHGRNGGVFVND